MASVEVGAVPPADIYLSQNCQDIYVDVGAPDTVHNYYNVANTMVFMRVRREFDVHNVELNLFSGPLFSNCNRGCSGNGYGAPIGNPGFGYGQGRGAFGGGGCGAGGCCAGGAYGGCAGGGCGAGGCAGGGAACGAVGPAAGRRFQMNWLLGVRYFKFDENLFFSADVDDTTFDYLPTNYGEFFHDVEVNNDLVGVQLGCNMEYNFTCCTSFIAGTKFGLYGNHMDVYQRIYNNSGHAYIDPLTPQNYTINVDDTDVAFLGEVRLGLARQVGCHWRLSGGYRAVAVSGVASAPHQMPVGRMLPALLDNPVVYRDGDLILHGGYGGVEYAW